jgi:hypothetical protein
MPHHTTWGRILGTAVDIAALEHVVRDRLSPAPPEVPAVRVLRSPSMARRCAARSRSGTPQGVHLVAAYLPHQGVVVAKLDVQTKDNELVIVAMRSVQHRST